MPTINQLVRKPRKSKSDEDQNLQHSEKAITASKNQ